VYPYSDLRDACEGRSYFIEEPDPRMAVLDHLQAEVGEKVLITQYHGDSYAQPPYRQGIFLTYRWASVRDKRIIPGGIERFNHYDKSYNHFAEYRIGDRHAGAADLIGDRWDVTYMAGSMAVGMSLGPLHVWSKAIVEAEGNTWPNHVTDQTEGEWSKKLLREKKQQGYQVYGEDDA
jgi:hypothetical protein